MKTLVVVCLSSLSLLFVFANFAIRIAGPRRWLRSLQVVLIFGRWIN